MNSIPPISRCFRSEVGRNYSPFPHKNPVENGAGESGAGDLPDATTPIKEAASRLTPRQLKSVRSEAGLGKLREDTLLQAFQDKQRRVPPPPPPEDIQGDTSKDEPRSGKKKEKATEPTDPEQQKQEIKDLIDETIATIDSLDEGWADRILVRGLTSKTGRDMDYARELLTSIQSDIDAKRLSPQQLEDLKSQVQRIKRARTIDWRGVNFTEGLAAILGILLVAVVSRRLVMRSRAMRDQLATQAEGRGQDQTRQRRTTDSGQRETLVITSEGRVLANLRSIPGLEHIVDSAQGTSDRARLANAREIIWRGISDGTITQETFDVAHFPLRASVLADALQGCTDTALVAQMLKGIDTLAACPKCGHINMSDTSRVVCARCATIIDKPKVTSPEQARAREFIEAAKRVTELKEIVATQTATQATRRRLTVAMPGETQEEAQARGIRDEIWERLRDNRLDPSVLDGSDPHVVAIRTWIIDGWRSLQNQGKINKIIARWHAPVERVSTLTEADARRIANEMHDAIVEGYKQAQNAPNNQVRWQVPFPVGEARHITLNIGRNGTVDLLFIHADGTEHRQGLGGLTAAPGAGLGAITGEGLKDLQQRAPEVARELVRRLLQSDIPCYRSGNDRAALTKFLEETRPVDKIPEAGGHRITLLEHAERYPTGAERVVIPDTNGDYDRVFETLENLHLIRQGNDGIHWIGGQTEVVFVGDIWFDRGTGSHAIFNLKRHLEIQGARIKVLWGNHDEYMLRGFRAYGRDPNSAGDLALVLSERSSQATGATEFARYLTDQQRADLIKEASVLRTYALDLNPEWEKGLTYEQFNQCIERGLAESNIYDINLVIRHLFTKHDILGLMRQDPNGRTMLQEMTRMNLVEVTMTADGHHRIVLHTPPTAAIMERLRAVNFDPARIESEINAPFREYMRHALIENDPGSSTERWQAVNSDLEIFAETNNRLNNARFANGSLAAEGQMQHFETYAAELQKHGYTDVSFGHDYTGGTTKVKHGEVTFHLLDLGPNAEGPLNAAAEYRFIADDDTMRDAGFIATGDRAREAITEFNKEVDRAAGEMVKLYEKVLVTANAPEGTPNTVKLHTYREAMRQSLLTSDTVLRGSRDDPQRETVLDDALRGWNPADDAERAKVEAMRAERESWKTESALSSLVLPELPPKAPSGTGNTIELSYKPLNTVLDFITAAPEEHRPRLIAELAAKPALATYSEELAMLAATESGSVRRHVVQDLLVKMRTGTDSASEAITLTNDQERAVLDALGAWVKFVQSNSEEAQRSNRVTYSNRVYDAGGSQELAKVMQHLLDQGKLTPEQIEAGKVLAYKWNPVVTNPRVEALEAQTTPPGLTAWNAEVDRWSALDRWGHAETSPLLPVSRELLHNLTDALQAAQTDHEKTLKGLPAEGAEGQVSELVKMTIERRMMQTMLRTDVIGGVNAVHEAWVAAIGTIGTHYPDMATILRPALDVGHEAAQLMDAINKGETLTDQRLRRTSPRALGHVASIVAQRREGLDANGQHDEAKALENRAGVPLREALGRLTPHVEGQPDPRYHEAVRIVQEHQTVNARTLQDAMNIPPKRAMDLLEEMRQHEIVRAYNPSTGSHEVIPFQTAIEPIAETERIPVRDQIIAITSGSGSLQEMAQEILKIDQNLTEYDRLVAELAPSRSEQWKKVSRLVPSFKHISRKPALVSNHNETLAKDKAANPIRRARQVTGRSPLVPRLHDAPTSGRGVLKDPVLHDAKGGVTDRRTIVEKMKTTEGVKFEAIKEIDKASGRGSAPDEKIREKVKPHTK